ncbi:MAG: DegT/DnrJ/EryC1/StrS family aminotransferase [Bacteroidales bacterium]|nr:DegT/DnrJ/EryC1/StrS family aminotransferase [Bacteroidales bacterium]
MNPIQMVDLKSQYLRIKPEVDAAIQRVLDSTAFIQGSSVFEFEQQLSQYTGSKYVVSCGNGTDALMAALLALGIGRGDEVITPAFTFVSTMEVIALLGATPVFVDVCEDTFNMEVQALEKAVTPKTKAIIPVHLYGQCADMEPILNIAKKHNVKVIEDACQAIGTKYTFSDGTVKQAGTMGDIGCLSFFPSKNLGCYGDGGALMTQDEDLAERLRAICKHGSKKKYHHQFVGFNSRLDTIQAAVLQVKLHHLDEFLTARNSAAYHYYETLKNVNWIELPEIKQNTTHTFHQFTLKVKEGKREALKQYLSEKSIPSMVYYPVPAHLQPAYHYLGYQEGDLPVSEQHSKEVLSLPMHTELSEDQLQYICQTIVNCPL